MKQQFFTLETFKRCTHRTNHVAWCRKLQKFCNAPTEYHTCATYQPKITKPALEGEY